VVGHDREPRGRHVPDLRTPARADAREAGEQQHRLALAVDGDVDVRVADVDPPLVHPVIFHHPKRGRLSSMNEETSGSGLGLRIIAFIALLVCAWILLKAVIGIVATVAWIVVIAAAIIGVLWAMSVLRH
jgi:hypothetical protein